VERKSCRKRFHPSVKPSTRSMQRLFSGFKNERQSALSVHRAQGAGPATAQPPLCHWPPGSDQSASSTEHPRITTRHSCVSIRFHERAAERPLPVHRINIDDRRACCCSTSLTVVPCCFKLLNVRVPASTRRSPSAGLDHLLQSPPFKSTQNGLCSSVWK
jgi:hypothetical protein